MKTTILNLIIVVLLVAVVGVAWFGYTNNQKNSLPTPPKELTAKTTTPQLPTLSSKAIETKKALTKTDQTYGDLVPATNAGFEIRYLIYDDQYFVRILEAPFDTNKAKVETWFKDKGFTSEELCLMRITYTASRQVKPDFQLADSVPTGCTPPPEPSLD